MFRAVPAIVALVAVFSAPTAFAADVVVTYDWQASGLNGWVQGYINNGIPTFQTRQTGSDVYIQGVTDEQFGTWGVGGGPLNNTLTYPAARYKDFTMTAATRADTGDNDVIGLVFHYVDAKNFYLVWMSAGGYSLPLGTGGLSTDTLFNGARLYKISNGVASQLAEATGDSKRYVFDQWRNLRVTMLGSSITVSYDSGNNGFNGGDVLFTTIDATPLPTGNIGVYCYDYQLCFFNDITIVQTDADGDGSVSDVDCNDAIAAIHPGAVEKCDAVDSDCDGLSDNIDAVDTKLWYGDADSDNHYGGLPSLACIAPPRSSQVLDDCNDENETIYVGAVELCNNVDDDCNTLVDDEPPGGLAVIPDLDKDGFGDVEARARLMCAVTPGYSLEGGDCDDADAAIHPEAEEVCNNIDDNCNDLTDENAGPFMYLDDDNDGFGTPETALQECEPSSGFVENSDDCDDTNPNISPAAEEVCNGADDDCNGVVDDEFPLAFWWPDEDHDGFGDELSEPFAACGVVADAAPNDEDCNDDNAEVSPDGIEVPDNGIDEDCDGIDAPGDTDDTDDSDTGDTDDTDFPPDTGDSDAGRQPPMPGTIDELAYPEGCGCTSTSTPGTAAWPALALLALGWTRWRRRSA